MRRRNPRWRRWVLIGLVAAVAALVPGSRAPGAGGHALVVKGYTVHGTRVAVRLYNSGDEVLGAAVATAQVGAQFEAGKSNTVRIEHGTMATVHIQYSGLVLGITEGPDPIPQ